MSANTSALPTKFQFRLFVAGDAANSSQAVANLRALCKNRLGDRCAIDVVDVFLDPSRALAEEVFMTPTLVKLGPGPSCRIVGSLSDAEGVLRALGVESRT